MNQQVNNTGLETLPVWLAALSGIVAGIMVVGFIAFIFEKGVVGVYGEKKKEKK